MQFSRIFLDLSGKVVTYWILLINYVTIRILFYRFLYWSAQGKIQLQIQIKCEFHISKLDNKNRKCKERWPWWYRIWKAYYDHIVIHAMNASSFLLGIGDNNDKYDKHGPSLIGEMGIQTIEGHKEVVGGMRGRAETVRRTYGKEERSLVRVRIRRDGVQKDRGWQKRANAFSPQGSADQRERGIRGHSEYVGKWGEQFQARRGGRMQQSRCGAPGPGRACTPGSRGPGWARRSASGCRLYRVLVTNSSLRGCVGWNLCDCQHCPHMAVSQMPAGSTRGTFIHTQSAVYRHSATSVTCILWDRNCLTARTQQVDGGHGPRSCGAPILVWGE